MKKLKELKKLLNNDKKMKLAVVAAEEENILIAVDSAYKDNIIIPVLIGNVEKIREYSNKNNINLEGYELVEAESFQESAEIAVKMVREGKADFLIKGLVDTGILLKTVLNKEYGLRTGKQLSHVMIYEVPNYHKLLFLTDGGMVTYPDLNTKADIIKNAVEVANAFKYDEIKVSCLAAKEKVNPKMPATVDGAKLKEMCQDGEFGENVFVEGPIALDLAVSKESAAIKKYESPVVGDSDILLVPNIEMGNGIGKAITYFGSGISAGIIMGAAKPIVLVSRADTFESKYYSILLGSVVASS